MMADPFWDARFGSRPCEWHSEVGAKARARIWRAVAKGEDADMVDAALEADVRRRQLSGDVDNLRSQRTARGGPGNDTLAGGGTNRGELWRLRDTTLTQWSNTGTGCTSVAGINGPGRRPRD